MKTYVHVRPFFFERNMLQTKIVEKIRTHILCSFFLSRHVYEKMYKNTAQPDRSQITIGRMGIACWIIKATETHSEHAIRIAFSRQNAPRYYIIHKLSILFCSTVSQPRSFRDLDCGGGYE